MDGWSEVEQPKTPIHSTLRRSTMGPKTKQGTLPLIHNDAQVMGKGLTKVDGNPGGKSEQPNKKRKVVEVEIKQSLKKRKFDPKSTTPVPVQGEYLTAIIDDSHFCHECHLILFVSSDRSANKQTGHPVNDSGIYTRSE